jgi:Chlorophyllase enzyme
LDIVRVGCVIVFQNMKGVTLPLLLALLICSLLDEGYAIAQYGDKQVQKKELYLPQLLNKSNPRAVVVFPKQILQSNNTEKFPLLVFAHGFVSGGWITYQLHTGLLNGLASFGFIVVAPRSCNVGCPGLGQWTTYDDEILKLLNYIDSRVDDTIFQFVNRTAGYGLVGHSAGGRATAQALQVANSATNKIKAGVILHPVTDTVNITVPTAVFTGTLDTCCGGEDRARPIYEGITSPARAYANMIDARHIEPYFNTDWTVYVSAWFKIYLTNDTSTYYNLIYGNDPDSLCGSTIPMTNNCERLQ